MSRPFVDLDSSLLVKLSDTLKDRICAKSFVNLQDYVEENFFQKREQLTTAFNAYLDHIKKVGYVHLDVTASDNYNPFVTDDRTARTPKVTIQCELFYGFYPMDVFL
ncbi:hypothetical protein P879_09995 [Paragonimus westermani]|uniref:Uncharacterized protein n=1 Tax=Paragonimus westermani TaxID=34504 RepID=A0A8T0DA59_9TREM|nr:hypothetical protein P879_09995 [Paragonimus westermani]